MVIKRSLDDNPLWAQTVIIVIHMLLSAITLYPMLNVLAKSFSEAHTITANPLMIVPGAFTVEAYKYIFSTPVLINSFAITVFVTAAGTLLNMVFTTAAAYGLSKTRVPGHKFFMWLIIIPMLIGAGLIPQYILYKDLGMLNSLWVLIIPGLVSPFNFILMRNFFWSIPQEMEESAYMDGASDLRVLWSIVLPLSKSALATVGLFYAVGHWNDYFNGLFFISDNSKWPLQVVLRSIIIDQNMMNMGSINDALSAEKAVVTPENIKAATIIFAMVPILLVYPFLQKYFVKGIFLGSVKG
ncbi:carbohydrate ABC transporter permease [Paenibacillus thermotolerans]|uniref:carbohydrate ABC transporter permease n=1 Tax=Paenibacillus thermotolerans TaxID=3027807 RepID=UPI002367B902|nr:MULTISPECIES: carbohydrate ABC transporter permease [unclassified Paenibacillus]